MVNYRSANTARGVLSFDWLVFFHLTEIQYCYQCGPNSYFWQIQTNERKAKDAYTQLRAKESKLRETLEILKKLKKGISDTAITVLVEE